MVTDKRYVPIGAHPIVCTNNKSFDLEIIEVLDDNRRVIYWYFPQKEIQELNKGRQYFPVGRLFCDWLNDAISGIENRGEFERSAEQVFASRTGMDLLGSVEYVLNKLNSYSEQDKCEIYNNFYECFQKFKYDTEVSVIPFGAAGRIGKKYVLHRMNQRTLQEAFFMIDFAELLNSKKWEVKQCIHCKRVFFVTEKNQKYCSVCRNDRIPEKIKHKNNQSYALRNKIYRRLSSRSTENDYGDGIKDADTFADLAKKKRKELSDDNSAYLSWLQEIEQRTLVYSRKKSGN